jgi:valyl-tRNA synthetase
MPKGEKKAGGRPKTVKKYSDMVKNNYLKAAKKIAKETGKTVEEHYLRMSIDPQVQASVRHAFGKLYNEALLIKESEQTINDKRSGPSIGLPPMDKRPPAPPPIEAMEPEEKRVH